VIDESKIERVLDYWKSFVSKTKKDRDYDLTQESNWIKVAKDVTRAVGVIKENEEPEQLRSALKEVLTKKRMIWAEPLRLMGTFLNNASKSELDQLKEIVLEIGDNDDFKNTWIERIYQLIDKKYPSSIQKFGESRTKAFIMNRIGEMFGKLHSDKAPVYNNCSVSILKKLGFAFDDRDYNSFKNSFDEFGKLYKKHLGKLSDYEMNPLVEIDQMFNFFDKNKDSAGKFLRDTTKGLKPELPLNIKISEGESKEIHSLLLNKKQIILYGPPGTGKTFGAQRFSVAFLTGISV
jgi:hypothetical protein